MEEESQKSAQTTPAVGSDALLGVEKSAAYWKSVSESIAAVARALESEIEYMKSREALVEELRNLVKLYT